MQAGDLGVHHRSYTNAAYSPQDSSYYYQNGDAGKAQQTHTDFNALHNKQQTSLQVVAAFQNCSAL